MSGQRRVYNESDNLKEGEIICPECRGTGDPDSLEVHKISIDGYACKKCNGKGKLDWIENIIGIKIEVKNET